MGLKIQLLSSPREAMKLCSRYEESSNCEQWC